MQYTDTALYSRIFFETVPEDVAVRAIINSLNFSNNVFLPQESMTVFQGLEQSSKDCLAALRRNIGGHCGIRMYSMTMSGTCATHVLTKANPKSCLVKAPAKHASESVLLVGELLCTGVQANTERHTRNGTREMCSCWGYKQHSSSSNSRVAWFKTSNRARVWQIWEAREDTWNLSLVQRPRKASDSSISSKSLCIAERVILILVPKNVDLKLSRDDTGDRLSRKQITQTSLLHCAEVLSESDIDRVSV